MGARAARVVIADPPWAFRDKLKNPKGIKRGAAANYRTMSLKDIVTYGRDNMPESVDADALLFLWRVAAMPGEALQVARAWGFEPKAEIVWVKTREAALPAVYPDDGRPPGTLAFGLGHYVRGAHETCIIARRGRARVACRSIRSVFFAPVGRHSEKPEEFYRIVERLHPGPYLELFARKRREGWSCYGDELPPDPASVGDLGAYGDLPP